MWLSVEADNGTSKRDDGSLRRSSTGDRSPLLTAQHLLAVCTGSGNFGSRSARRDMESNLVLIFPPSSNLTTNPLARHQVEEWNRLCEHASKEEAPKLPDPPLWIRFVFPIIRSFF
jgi:phosphatidylserine/phosphatidylglycerophosphate/cardiolipin synthase-like enzyme